MYHISFMHGSVEECTTDIFRKGLKTWRIKKGRTDTEVEVPMLWPPDTKSRLTGKDPDAGKD